MLTKEIVNYFEAIRCTTCLNISCCYVELNPFLFAMYITNYEILLQCTGYSKGVIGNAKVYTLADASDIVIKGKSTVQMKETIIS